MDPEDIAGTLWATMTVLSLGEKAPGNPSGAKRPTIAGIFEYERSILRSKRI